MLTDYQISFIKQTVGKTKLCVLFYEGEMQDVDIKSSDENGDEVINSVNTYVRTGFIKEEMYSLSGQLSQSEIDTFLKGELAKDLTRTPIDEQSL